MSPRNERPLWPTNHTAGMTCRGTIRGLLRGREAPTVTPVEVALFMWGLGKPYTELTIRGQISHVLCADEPDPAGKGTQDLERLERRRSRLHDAQL